MKAATCYTAKSFFKNCSQEQQIASSSYERTQTLVKFLINTCLRSEFSAQICRNRKTFPFTRIDVQSLYNKAQVSSEDPTKLAIHSILLPEDDLLSNCGQIFRKTVSFDEIVHFIDEAGIIAYEDVACGITLYPETPTKVREINREGSYISRSCKKPSALPITFGKSILLMSSITLISFWTRTIYGTWFQ